MLNGKNEKTRSPSTGAVGKMKKHVIIEKSAFTAAVSPVIRTTPLIRDEVKRGRKKPANMIAPRH
jgi:hypothetical protein